MKNRKAMVYVLDRKGKPLMPTRRCGKVRHLLGDGLAEVVSRTPFVIKLLYDSTGYVQNVTLGVDAGTAHIGLSASEEKKEYLSAEVMLRTDVVERLSRRREARSTRRSRKTRYRKKRFNNRKRPEGWVAPSVEQKIVSHLNVMEKVNNILPISRTVIEVGQFDTQLLKNPDIGGTDYQNGEQSGFWNVREYVLFRDGHRCQCCHGKSGDRILNVHHIESRMTGGNSPSNLVTLCETCHKALHRGEVKLDIRRSSQPLRDAAVMGIMKKKLYERASLKWRNVSVTYGYATKRTRIINGLEKGHRTDALCISGHPQAVPCPVAFQARQVARHTRSLHVFTMSKGGKRRSAVAPHWIGKSRLQRYDTVLWNGITAFIAGSTGGRPVLRDINWKRVTDSQSVNPKSVKFLCRKHGSFLIQTI